MFPLITLFVLVATPRALNPPALVTTYTCLEVSTDKLLHLPSTRGYPHPDNNRMENPSPSPKKTRYPDVDIPWYDGDTIVISTLDGWHHTEIERNHNQEGVLSLLVADSSRSAVKVNTWNSSSQDSYFLIATHKF